MSLINKVLKDLDKRGQEPFNAEADGSAVERSGTKSILPWTILALTIAGVLLAVTLWPVADDHSMTVYEGTKPQQKELPEQQPDTDKWVSSESIAEQRPDKTQEKKRDKRTLKAEPDNVQPSNSAPPEPEMQAHVGEKTEALAAEKIEKTRQQPEEKVANTDGVFLKKNVQLSPKEIAQNNIEKAEKAQQQGRLTQAEEYWRKALAATPDNKNVRKKLAALQYGRNKVTDALATLETGFQRDKTDTDFRMLSARILEREAKPGAALNVLLKNWPKTEENPDYSQKVALLAQDTGNSSIAEAAYSRLVDAQPNEGRWYVGKALAQEQQDSAAALKTYQLALERVTHAPTRQFIERKVAALSAQIKSVGKP